MSKALFKRRISCLQSLSLPDPAIQAVAPSVGPGIPYPKQGPRPLWDSTCRAPLHPLPTRPATPPPCFLPAPRPARGPVRAAVSKLRKPSPKVRGAQCWKSIQPAQSGGGLSLEPQPLPGGMLSVGPEGRGRRRGGRVGQRPWAQSSLCCPPTTPCPGLSSGRVLGEQHLGQKGRGAGAGKGAA